MQINILQINIYDIAWCHFERLSNRVCFCFRCCSVATFGQGGRSATVHVACWLIWWRQSVAAQAAHRRLTRTCRWTWPVPDWRWTGWARAPGSGADCPPIPRPCWPVTCNSWAPRSNTWWPWSIGRFTGCHWTGYRTLATDVKTGRANRRHDFRIRHLPLTTTTAQRPQCSSSSKTTVAACTMTPTTLYHTSTQTPRTRRPKTDPAVRSTTTVSFRRRFLIFEVFDSFGSKNKIKIIVSLLY